MDVPEGEKLIPPNLARKVKLKWLKMLLVLLLLRSVLVSSSQKKEKRRKKNTSKEERAVFVHSAGSDL